MVKLLTEDYAKWSCIGGCRGDTRWENGEVSILVRPIWKLLTKILVTKYFIFYKGWYQI